MHGTQIDTLKLQVDYDTKLNNATYDAIKAFQMNTVNSSTSDLVNSKIEDIEAASKAFFTSVASTFNMVGYNSDILKNYVPALVFTLYDGFYIYSPFDNNLDAETSSKLSPNSTYQPNEQITTLKSYIPYSCRYKTSTTDVVITYSLDNYITIQGTVNNGTPIYDAGYLIDPSKISYNNDKATYRGVDIEKETLLEETIKYTASDGKTIKSKTLPCLKVNGTKYYYINDSTEGNKTGWYTITNGRLMGGQPNFGDGNTIGNEMAYLYYKESKDFTERLESYGVLNLTSADAVDENGNNISNIVDADNNTVYDFVNGNYNILSLEDIEKPDSDFNQHRLAVIRYTIEKNLSVAIANYNTYKSGGALSKYEFRMPKLKETDWDRILNNVSLISFLQGLNIGGRIYNGYSVINNNKNEEVVTEDSIYIANDSTYYKVTADSLVGSGKCQGMRGYFNTDFERKALVSNGVTTYYYPKTQLGDYTGYVTQTATNDANGNIYDYLDTNNPDKKELAKIYYTALGRERYSMYKVYRNPEKHIEKFVGNTTNLPNSDSSQTGTASSNDKTEYKITINYIDKNTNSLIKKYEAKYAKNREYNIQLVVPDGYEFCDSSQTAIKGTATGDMNFPVYCQSINSFNSVSLDIYNESETESNKIKSENLEIKGNTITYDEIALHVPSDYEILDIDIDGGGHLYKSGDSYDAIGNDSDIVVIVKKKITKTTAGLVIYQGRGTVIVSKNIEINGDTITYDEIASYVPSEYEILDIDIDGGAHLYKSGDSYKHGGDIDDIQVKVKRK